MDPSRVSTSKIEFSEMLDVPRVLRFSIPVFQAHTSWSEDVHHSVGSLPLWGELMIGGVLLPSEHKVSRMELPGTDPSAVIPAHPLQIAGGPHYCPTTDLLKEVDIIKMFFHVVVIVIDSYPRRSIFKIRGQHGFGPINKRKQGLAD
jgi:hypothetical protein